MDLMFFFGEIVCFFVINWYGGLLWKLMFLVLIWLSVCFNFMVLCVLVLLCIVWRLVGFCFWNLFGVWVWSWWWWRYVVWCIIGFGFFCVKGLMCVWLVCSMCCCLWRLIRMIVMMLRWLLKWWVGLLCGLLWLRWLSSRICRCCIGFVNFLFISVLWLLIRFVVCLLSVVLLWCRFLLFFIVLCLMFWLVRMKIFCSFVGVCLWNCWSIWDLLRRRLIVVMLGLRCLCLVCWFVSELVLLMGLVCLLLLLLWLWLVMLVSLRMDGIL